MLKKAAIAQPHIITGCGCDKQFTRGIIREKSSHLSETSHVGGINIIPRYMGNFFWPTKDSSKLAYIHPS